MLAPAAGAWRPNLLWSITSIDFLAFLRICSVARTSDSWNSNNEPSTSIPAVPNRAKSARKRAKKSTTSSPTRSRSGNRISPPGIIIRLDISSLTAIAALRLLVMTVSSLRRRKARATFKVDEPIEIKIVAPSGICVSAKSAIARFPVRLVPAR